MIAKYNFEFSNEQIDTNVQRLTNQMWKLIPMRENEENWEGQLEQVIIEISGLKEIFSVPQFLQLLSKLEGIRNCDMDFFTYRKTVFESISLLQEIKRAIRV